MELVEGNKPAQKQYTPQEIKDTLWRRGELGWKLKPIQKRLRAAFRASKRFIFISLVARQTGKTFDWAIEAIELAIKNPKARIRFGTAFQSDLEEFIIPVFDAICQDAPEDIKPVYKGHGSKYFFPGNRSEIKLFGIDKNPNGVRGNALDFVLIEEAGFCDKLRQVVSIIIFMLRHRPSLRVALSSSAPETPDHEFVEFIEAARLDGSIFEATINDDETCTKETKDRIAEECGGYDSTTYRREALNEIITDADLAIIPEWDDKYVQALDRDEFYGYYHKYNALDSGVVHFTANLYGHYDFLKAKLIIEDETAIRGPKMTTDLLAEMIRKKEDQLWAVEVNGKRIVKTYLRVADNNNLQLVNDLSLIHHLAFVPTDKDELPAMVNEVRLMVNQGAILVHPRCKMLLGCLRGGVYNSKSKKREFATSKVYGHYDHLAALIYLVRNLNRQTNPIPAQYGFTKYTHFVRNESKVPDEVQQAWKVLSGKKHFSTRKLPK